MPPKFFITHSWKDIDFARKLCDDLRENGLEGFFDERSVRPGESIPSRIESGLAECDYYLPVFSPDALQSPWCEWEIDMAITMNRTRQGRPHIIPVIAKPCAVPDRLIHISHINFVNRYDDALKELLSKGFGLTLQTPPLGHSIHPATTENRPSEINRASESVPQDKVDRLYTDGLEALYADNLEESMSKFRQLAAIQPDYEDAKSKLLLVIYTIASEALRVGAFAKAIQFFTEILQIDPAYSDATSRLMTAKQELDVEELYAGALQAEKEETWTEVIEKLESILKIKSVYKDVKTRLEEARRRKPLADSYKRALKAIGAKKWQDALMLLDQIHEIDPNYRETKQMFEAAWKIAPKKYIGKDGKEMLLIPAGEFIMGEGGEAHKVHLNAFYIDRYPVTNTEYRNFIIATKSEAPSHWSGKRIAKGGEDHPVVNVTWHDAQAYARWTGKQLPTEAEWEKAAGWSAEEDKKRTYPWGEEFDPNRCNVFESGVGDTTPVDTYSPEGDSSYGVSDLAGNVWEWCADWFADNYYSISRAENPNGPDSGNTRVLRGGCWHNSAQYARCTNRNKFDPAKLNKNIGFRCVISLINSET